MYIVKHYHDTAPHDYFKAQDPCLHAAGKTVALRIQNDSNIPVQKIGFATFGWGDNYFRGPFEIAEVKSKTTRSIDVSKENFKMWDCRIKFFINNKMRTAVEEANFPWFYRCVIVVVHPSLEYTVAATYEMMSG